MSGVRPVGSLWSEIPAIAGRHCEALRLLCTVFLGMKVLGRSDRQLAAWAGPTDKTLYLPVEYRGPAHKSHPERRNLNPR